MPLWDEAHNNRTLSFPRRGAEDHDVSRTMRHNNNKMEQIKPKAFCNDFYLVGGCHWGSSCLREHERTLTSEEIAIHRYRARSGPCTVGPSCRNFDCYSSHHCPIRNCSKGSVCIFSKTYHGDLHLRRADDLRPAIKWIEGQQFPEKTE